MIQLDCEACNQSIRVLDHFAWRRAKCKACGHILSVPTPSPAEMNRNGSVGAELNPRPSAKRENTPLNASEKRTLRIGIIAAIVIVLLLLAVFVLPGQVRHWRHNRAFAQIEPQVQRTLQLAKDNAAIFEFDEARQCLTHSRTLVAEADKAHAILDFTPAP